nr:NlpC/P60 family protein [Lentilactobacillus kisonensis]
MRPPNLATYYSGLQGASYHVAIYIGNNQYVAAPQPGQNVQIQTINKAFMPSFAGHVNG